MKAAVTEILKGPDRQVYVAFTCAAGDGIALWRGRREPKHEIYDVEIDIETKLMMAMLTESQTPSQRRLGRNDMSTRIHAPIDDVDDDGVCYLRVGVSGLIMVESEFTSSQRGSMVSFEVARDLIAITPFGFPTP